MRSLLILAAAVTALSACAPAPPAPRTARAANHLNSMLAGRVAGAAVECLPRYQASNMIAIDDGTVLFREGSRLWRNDFNGGKCYGISGGRYALVTDRLTTTTSLCRGDLQKVMDLSSGMVVGSCTLGDFVPYTKPRA